MYANSITPNEFNTEFNNEFNNAFQNDFADEYDTTRAAEDSFEMMDLFNLIDGDDDDEDIDTATADMHWIDAMTKKVQVKMVETLCRPAEEQQPKAFGFINQAILAIDRFTRLSMNRLKLQTAIEKQKATMQKSNIHKSTQPTQFDEPIPDQQFDNPNATDDATNPIDPKTNTAISSAISSPPEHLSSLKSSGSLSSPNPKTQTNTQPDNQLNAPVAKMNQTSSGSTASASMNAS